MARWIFAKISLAPSRLLSSCSLKWSPSLGPLTFQPIRKLLSAIDTFSFFFSFLSFSVSDRGPLSLVPLEGKIFLSLFLALISFFFTEKKEMLINAMHGGWSRSYYVISSSFCLSLSLSLSFVPVKNNSVYLLFKFWPRFFPRAASRARQLWISNMNARDRSITRELRRNLTFACMSHVSLHF